MNQQYHGGPRPNSGRKPRDGSRGRSISVYLSPREQSACLLLGVTIQDGLRELIRRHNEEMQKNA